MSNTDRPSRHGLTPEPYERFADVRKRDTEPAMMLPENMPDLGDGKSTLTGFKEAFERVDAAIESNASELKDRLNGVRSLMLEHYARQNVKYDNVTKTVRAVVAEVKAIREFCGMPPVEPIPDDL